MSNTILIVEDELIVARDIRRILEKSGYEVTGIATSVESALKLIATKTPFLVLLDIYLESELTGIDLAVRLNQMNIPFVYLSANSNQQVLEQAKVTNPYGFIVKPFREKDLLISLDIARYRFDHDMQLQDNNSSNIHNVIASQHSPEGSDKFNADVFEGIVGASAGMKNVFSMIAKVAPLNTSVLILGENGTGKEGIANAIHKLSPRQGKPFVKINCGAMPVHLIESELFGHEKGSFTGAIERKIGKFEQAAGGTILLDEIGEMNRDMQVKLLRVLQEREIDRVGGNRSIKVDVRVIASTNKNLEKEIAEGRFRLDLYYRLLVFPITLPSLRERAEDIEILTVHFMRLYSARNHKNVTKISVSALKQLREHDWPGNIRELEYLIERTILLTSGPVINDFALPKAREHHNMEPYTPKVSKTMDEMEAEHIMTVLKQCNNKIAGPAGAAEVLDLAPSTLYSRMKKLGILRKF